MKSFDAGTEPNGLLYAYGSLWVGDYGGGKLLKLDPASGRVRGAGRSRTPTGSPPRPARCGCRASRARSSASTRRRGAVKATIKVGANPLATAWIGGELWVPSIDADSVSIVDPATNRCAKTRKAGFGPASVVQAGGSIWVCGLRRRRRLAPAPAR